MLFHDFLLSADADAMSKKSLFLQVPCGLGKESDAWIRFIRFLYFQVSNF